MLSHNSSQEVAVEHRTAAELLARPDQALSAHLLAVAHLAETFAARFGAVGWGRALGLLHDMGKASAKFQRRVRGEAVRVDHSTAGARHANAAWAGVGRLLAYGIAGHHSGLPDGVGGQGVSLEQRLNPAFKAIEDASTWRACLGELADITPPAAVPFATNGRNAGFRFALFLRMAFSCLVDADRLDAEAAGDAESLERAARRTGYPDLEVLAQSLDAFLAEMADRAEDTKVNGVRAEVLAACRAAAEQAPGLFTLTVPTGGGKTLSSLAFALEHARRYGLDRIIYVIPYTSIIEQNARVFRKALGDANGDFVVEHHSNLAPPQTGGDADSAVADERPHPATENWDAPVIVTTAVQFFESLFSARAGRCRKLHNLARSVIILDEAQMLPLRCLLPCIEALRELTATYGASVVLCTATQPALNAPENGGEGLKGGLATPREIMPDPVAMHAKLKRVAVRHQGEVLDADLAERLAAEPQVLCIVNTRRMARRLFDALRQKAGLPQEGLFHLSALMCPEHRSATLDRIRLALKEKRPCRVVSTTLVEAGVDVDFPVVWRAEGGIDSIAQAAGRCNREGLRAMGQVFVFRPEGGLPKGDFRRTAQAAQSVAGRHPDDLLHPDAVRDYFLELYWSAGQDQLDAERILKRMDATLPRFDFPFREIERDFQLIDSATQGIIIPYGDAAGRLVQQLRHLPQDASAKSLMRKLQRHTISLYERDFARLEREGAIERLGPGGQFFALANMSLYDELVGLDLFRDEPGLYAPEDIFI